MLKIRRPLGRLIFNMGIAIPGKTVFLIETAPRLSLTRHVRDQWRATSAIPLTKDVTNLWRKYLIYCLGTDTLYYLNDIVTKIYWNAIMDHDLR